MCSIRSPPVTTAPAAPAAPHGACDIAAPEPATSSRRVRPGSSLRVGADIFVSLSCEHPHTQDISLLYGNATRRAAGPPGDLHHRRESPAGVQETSRPVGLTGPVRRVGPVRLSGLVGLPGRWRLLEGSDQLASRRQGWEEATEDGSYAGSGPEGMSDAGRSQWRRAPAPRVPGPAVAH